MDLFFDSSALAKRYIQEIGSSWVTATVDPQTGNSIFLAAITRVEITAAIARRTRGGFLTATAANASFAQLQYDLQAEYLNLEVTPAILRSAQDLARKYFLRGYDAVQLAVAVACNVEQTAVGLPTITLVSADKELLIAASAENLLIENPQNHP